MAGAGIFAAIKFGKAKHSEKAIQKIEKKFTDLQNDILRVQKTFDAGMQLKVRQSVDALLDKGIIGDELKKTLSEKYKAEIDEILRKNFGELNPNNIPKHQKKLAQKLIKSQTEKML